MRDHIVRAAFHQTILRDCHRAEHTFVVDELGLKNGAIRADIAVLNGKMVGYEIKTDKDTLKRLGSQVIAYSEIFDEAFVITGEKHLEKVMEQLPEWWGVYLIEPFIDENCGFFPYRRAKPNQSQNAYSIAQLLWKEEVINLLENQFSCRTKQHWTKNKLYDLLIERCSTQTLSQIVLGILKNRQGWRTNQPLLW